MTKIVFKNGESPNQTIITLGDTFGGIPIWGYRVNNRRVVDVGEFIDSLFARPFARKNRINRISFNTMRESLDFESAATFISEYPDSIPDDGTLELIGTNGSAETTRYGLLACVESVDLIEQVGVASFWTHTILCGKIGLTAA